MELSSFDNGTITEIMGNGELTMTQSGNNVELGSGGDTLAIVYNVSTSDLTETDFTAI